MTTPSTPRRRLPRAVRERQMLDAAVEVFSRHGFHAASMDEVAEVAGVSKPMIYAYLGAKDDLFRACIRREGERLMERVAAAVVPDLPADQRLHRGLLAFFAFVADHRDGWNVLYRQARVHGPFAADISVQRGQIVGLVATLLAGTGDPVIRAKATPTAAALVGAAEALADWGVEHPEQSPQALVARLMDLVWTGLGGVLRGERWSTGQTGR